MSKPTLCFIHNGIGNQNAIAKVAMASVQQALKAGWRVTVVAELLDASLQGEVEWLKLFVPPRLFLLKWLVARPTILAAMGRRRFDIIHANQPQIAAIADVMQCHFLTRVAYEHHCLEGRSGFRAACIRFQEQMVLYAEDLYYRHLNQKTQMLFVSEMLQNDFHRLYGQPKNEGVLVSPFPSINFPSLDERRLARISLLGEDFKGIVVGYLGGLYERKGYKRLIKALEGNRDIFLLMGGQYSDGFNAPALSGHFKSFGLVSDTNRFYAACDVFIVPSLFDPLPMVVFEAVSRGLPVIASEEVGTLPYLLRYNTGVCWKEGQLLAPLIRKLAAEKTVYNSGTRKMEEELGHKQYGERLLSIYEEILRRKRARPNN